MALENLTYLVIEANSGCNLKCVTCNREELVEKGFRPFKNLSLNEFEVMLDQLEGAPIDTIKFEGLSEPMMHPRFHELAQALRNRYPKAFVIIATNLQYQVEKTPLLRTLPFVDLVYLSIDGTFERYEQARRGARYSRLLKSLDFLKSNVLSEIRQNKMQINMTVTPDNVMDIPAVYELRDHYGLGPMRLNVAQNWSEDQNISYEFSAEFLSQLQPYREDVKGVPDWDFKDCFWPHSGTVIDVEGNVRQCLLNTSQKPFGNIHETSFKEIFANAPELLAARKSLLKNSPNSACVNCSYKTLARPLREIIGQGSPRNRPRQWQSMEASDVSSTS